MSRRKPIAVVTGASAGIGAATVRRLAAEGFVVIAGARRVDRLASVVDGLDARALQLDVTDDQSVARFADEVEELDVLINNAGKAVGLESLSELPPEHARDMWETNVLGVLNMIRTFLPKIERAAGHIVNVGSTSSFETYPKGAGYTSTKHALRAITRTLRLELVGTPVRVTEISPGLVETEFSRVRFANDEERAAKVYEGIDALAPEDVAECIAWAVTRPPHVDIDEIVVRPVAQATSSIIARRPTSDDP